MEGSGRNPGSILLSPLGAIDDMTDQIAPADTGMSRLIRTWIIRSNNGKFKVQQCMQKSRVNFSMSPVESKRIFTWYYFFELSGRYLYHSTCLFWPVRRTKVALCWTLGRMGNESYSFAIDHFVAWKQQWRLPALETGVP